MSLRTATACVFLTLAIAGCDSDRRAISRDDLPDVPQQPAVVVEMTAGGFDPREITVSTEELVEFVNAGDDEHGLRTSDSSIHTGMLLPGESTYVMFDQPDEYELVDLADDDQTMTVVATTPPPSD